MADVEFNPFRPEFVADPYPFYRRLREQDPVHESPFGFWVLTRYDDVMTALRDQRFGRGGFEHLLRDRIAGPADELSMLFRDPPDHTRLRGLVNKAFTPRVVEGLRPRIQQLIDELLDRAQDARALDVIADFAYPLAVIVICEMLGVPARDRDRFKQWSADIARGLDAISLPAPAGVAERGRAANAALLDYFRALIAERRGRPRPDLLTALIAAEEQGQTLSEGELLSTCVLLLVAGHETTVNLIGNGLLALLRHPAELAAVRADPALAPSAVEVLLRYDGPVRRTGRITSAEVELGGKTIPKGALVLSMLGGANRDPAHFPDPDRLDIRRGDTRHLGFGWGIHFCLGAPLARVEAQLALATLLRRRPGLALATATPEWREGTALRGLKALPLTF
jgi:hypothetical protein